MMTSKSKTHRRIRRSPKPGNAQQRADFLVERIFPMWRNDLSTVVEARCAVPGHGVRGHSANFTACLMCLIACESLADLAAPSDHSRGAECRRWFWNELSNHSGDSRYVSLGEPMFVWFRHGVAHRFLPKAGGGVMYHLAAREESGCAQELGSAANADELMHLRAEWHLRLHRRRLTVLPQVLYVDLMSWFDEFETRLKVKPRSVTTKAFNRWWTDTVIIRRHLLTSDEWAMMDGRRSLPPLLVKTFEPVPTKGGGHVRFTLQRTTKKWLIREQGRSAVRFDNRDGAEDYYVERQRELNREFYS